MEAFRSSSACRGHDNILLGLPYYQLTNSFQTLLSEYPEEGFEWMQALWNPMKGYNRVERMDLKGQPYLLKGGSAPYEWVWDENSPPLPPPSQTTLPSRSWSQMIITELFGWNKCRNRVAATDETSTPTTTTTANATITKEVVNYSKTDLVESWLVPIPNVCDYGPNSFLSLCLQVQPPLLSLHKRFSHSLPLLACAGCCHVCVGVSGTRQPHHL